MMNDSESRSASGDSWEGEIRERGLRSSRPAYPRLPPLSERGATGDEAANADVFPAVASLRGVKR